MRTRTLYLAAAAVCGATVTGCSSDTAGPEAANLSVAEANALAPQFDGVSHMMVDGHLLWLNGGYYGGAFGGPGGDGVTEVQFTVTRACPVSGTVTVAGTARREVNRSTHTVASHVQATSTAAACTYSLRDGVTIAITGNPNIAIEADRLRIEGRPSGIQTLTHRGGFDWMKSTGESGTCVVDITATVDPGTRTRTVSGTFCNRTINRSVTWTVPTG